MIPQHVGHARDLVSALALRVLANVSHILVRSVYRQGKSMHRKVSQDKATGDTAGRLRIPVTPEPRCANFQPSAEPYRAHYYWI